MPGPEESFRQARGLAQAGRLPEAVQLLQAMTRRAPGFFPAQRLLGHLAFRQGNFDLAVQALEKGLELEPQDPGCQLALAEILRRAIPQGYQPALDTRLTTLLAGDVVKHQDLALVAARLLKLKHPLPGAEEALLSDPLLHLLLTRCVLVNGELERLLTGIRREVLLEDRGLPRAALIALATQAFNNNAAWSLVDDEATAVKTGIAALSEGSGDAGLLPVLLYRPLAELPQAEALAEHPLDAWAEDLQPLVRASLLEPLELRAATKDIPSLGGGLEERPLPLLVAGGGTGRQPLSLARAFPETRVLSVDLSRASLAYARQRAGAFGIENFEVLQGDILALGRLGRRFPAIACTGVLHHMAEPLAGWQVLTELLEPGGVMQIALYSRLARQDIAAARARIAELGLSDSPDDIRAFRRRVLEGQEPALAELTEEKDFADLHGCRDLLFHRQEHRFDLGEIASALDELGLEFLGFDLAGPEIAQAYRAANPQDPAMTDLAAWQAFEQAHPKAFRTMYNFWCRKPESPGG